MTSALNGYRLVTALKAELEEIESIKLKLANEAVENSEDLKKKFEELEISIKMKEEQIAELPRDELNTPETEIPSEFMEAAQNLLRGLAISGEELDRLFQVFCSPTALRRKLALLLIAEPFDYSVRFRRGHGAVTLLSVDTLPNCHLALARRHSMGQRRQPTCWKLSCPTRRRSRACRDSVPTTSPALFTPVPISLPGHTRRAAVTDFFLNYATKIRTVGEIPAPRAPCQRVRCVTDNRRRAAGGWGVGMWDARCGSR